VEIIATSLSRRSRAAAEHQHAGGIAGVGDFPDLHLPVCRAVGQQLEAAGGKLPGILPAAAAGDVDQIGIAQLPEQRQVCRRGEARVEDHHGLEARLDELELRRALDLFGAEKRGRKIPGRAGKWQEKSFGVRHYILTF
jgi:hypothetical protein